MPDEVISIIWPHWYLSVGVFLSISALWILTSIPLIDVYAIGLSYNARIFLSINSASAFQSIFSSSREIILTNVAFDSSWGIGLTCFSNIWKIIEVMNS